MKILIADDEKVIRKIIEASLRVFNDEILTAPGGDEAWEIISQGEVSLVITDWIMPGLSGVDLIQKVRQADFQHYVYMVLLTARSDKNDIVAGLEAGADDYLVKPFSVPELRARISIGKRILNYQLRLQETQARLLDMATHDSLTGLLNRRALYDQLGAELERASHGRVPLSVIMFDIDHFKKVNDTYGHLVGDKVLCLVTKKIEKNLRPYDWVGRWGGEEFLVVMRQTTEEEAVKIAERIRTSIAEIRFDFTKDVEDLRVYVSGGVGVAGPGRVAPGEPAPDSENWDMDDLVHRADMALYRAKQSGRNRVCTMEGSVQEPV